MPLRSNDRGPQHVGREVTILQGLSGIIARPAKPSQVLFMDPAQAIVECRLEPVIGKTVIRKTVIRKAVVTDFIDHTLHDLRCVIGKEIQDDVLAPISEPGSVDPQRPAEGARQAFDAIGEA